MSDPALDPIAPDAWMRAVLANLPGASAAVKEEWGATRFLVADKMFGLLGTDGGGNRVLTLKGLPANNAVLRAQHPGITPGYYMNKTHWVSLRLGDDAPPLALAEELLAESYRLVVAGLPKRLRDGLTA